MPSPIGHLLAGAAIGWALEPFARDAPAPAPAPRSAVRPPAWTPIVVACALLAAVPDVDLLYTPWHRRMTHSLLSAVAVTIVAAAVTGWVTRRHVWKTALICGAAYASHIALDWMGTDLNPPRGIQALWPFSDAWFISGWDIFPRTERRAIFSGATVAMNLRAALLEVAIVSPFAAAAWWVRGRRRR